LYDATNPGGEHYHQQQRRKIPMAELTLAIDGMHCGACVRRAGQALSQIPGLTIGEIRVGAARLAAEDPESAALAAVDALAKAGYTAHRSD